MDNHELLPLGYETHRPHRLRPPEPWHVRGLQLSLRALGSIHPDLAAHLGLKIYSTPFRKQPRAAELEILKEAEPITLRFQGRLLKGYSMGVGPAVLLVHGWSDCAASLAHFMPALAEAGFRAVAFDGPAHGASPGSRTDIIHYGDYIERALEHVGDARGVIGHSFGGSALMLRLSDRPGLALEKIVTIGAPAQFENTLSHFSRRMALTPPVTSALTNLVEARIRRPLKEIRIQHVQSLIPALIVHDREDRIVPFGEALKIESAWPQKELLATEGLGHSRILRDPEVIEKVVNFLLKP